MPSFLYSRACPVRLQGPFTSFTFFPSLFPPTHHLVSLARFQTLLSFFPSSLHYYCTVYISKWALRPFVLSSFRPFLSSQNSAGPAQNKPLQQCGEQVRCLLVNLYICTVLHDKYKRMDGRKFHNRFCNVM